MRRTLGALARWCSICGLWLLIAILILPAAILHLLSGAHLVALEALKAKADQLWRGAQ